MSYEKGTWGHDENRTHGDVSAALNQTAWYLWYALRVLLGQVGTVDQSGTAISPTGFQDWTVAQSSNGVTASAADNLHLTSGSFTASDWVWVSASGSRSWALLTNARLGISLLIDCVGASNSIHYYLLYTTPTTGTVSAQPTATTMVSFAGGGAMPIFDQTAGATRKVHAHVAPDGSFFILSSKDSSGAYQSGIWLHKLAGLQAGDSYPWVFGGGYQPTGYFRANTSDFFGNSGSLPGGYCYDLTASQQCLPITLNTPIGGSIFTQAIVPNADSTTPGANMSFFAVGSKRVKGRAQDWLLCPSANGDGWLEPASPAAAEFGQIGHTLLPIRSAALL